MTHLLASRPDGPLAKWRPKVKPIAKPFVMPAMFVAAITSNDPAVSNGSNMQALLDFIPLHGGIGRLPAGIFKHDMLYVSGNTELIGAGMYQTTLYCPATTTSKMQNRNPVFLGDGNRIDKRIIFRDLCLAGDPKAPIGTGIGCFDWLGIEDLRFVNCRFVGHRHFVHVPTNCDGILFDGCIFDDWGVLGKYSGPPGGREAGTAVFGWQPNWNVTFRNCLFKNGAGGGIWLDAGGGAALLEDLEFDRVSEFGVCGLPEGTLVQRITGRNVTRDDVSGHLFEIGGKHYRISEVDVADCDGVGVYLTDAQDVEITDVTATRCNQGDPAARAMSGCIIMRTADPDPAKSSRGVSLKRVTARCPDRCTEHALSMVNFSGNPKALMQMPAMPEFDSGAPAQWVSPVGYYPSKSGVIANEVTPHA